MIFIVIENFSEKVDPAHRRKRLANVLKAARRSAANATSYDSWARAGLDKATTKGANYQKGLSISRAKKAMKVYGKKRGKWGQHVGFKSTPGAEGPRLSVIRSRMVGTHGKKKSPKRKIGKN